MNLRVGELYHDLNFRSFVIEIDYDIIVFLYEANLNSATYSCHIELFLEQTALYTDVFVEEE